MSSRAALLGDVAFFQLLDAEERTALAAMLDEEDHDAAAVIFNVGDPGDRMYVVCSGAVELSASDKLGQKLMLMTARPGDMFGELSLLDEGPRTACATVLERANLLVLGRSVLSDFFLRHPHAALDMMTVMGRRMRATTQRLRQTATRNANEAIAQKVTPLERATDWIAAFSGSIQFLMLHAAVFAAWIGLNVVPGLGGFDPFPFGLLTMCVSLEAIFLSVIVLLSQNRQAAKERIRADIEYDVNVRAELEVSHLHAKVDHLNSAILARLQAIENRLKRS